MGKLLYTLVLTVCLAAFQLYSSAAPSTDERVSELLALQQQAKEGVIHLDTSSFERLAHSKSRPYSLVIFFSVSHLMDHPVIKLADLRTEYGYLAKSYASEPAAAGKLFLTELSFDESKDVFMQLGVSTVPYLVRLGPEVDPKPAGLLPVPEQDRMHVNSTRKYPWSAEDMGAFILRQTGIQHGEVQRPSFLKSPFFPVFVLINVALVGFIGWKVYQTRWIRHKAIWITGSLVIYWFATSGGMFNIIRGMPMYTMGKDGRIVYFLAGQRGMQLGVEGFSMGSTYIVFSGILASFTYLLPRMEDSSARSVTGLVLIAAAVYTYYKIFDLYRLKTGMGSANYLTDE